MDMNCHVSEMSRWHLVMMAHSHHLTWALMWSRPLRCGPQSSFPRDLCSSRRFSVMTSSWHIRHMSWCTYHILMIAFELLLFLLGGEREHEWLGDFIVHQDVDRLQPVSLGAHECQECHVDMTHHCILWWIQQIVQHRHGIFSLSQLYISAIYTYIYNAISRSV